MSNTKQFPWVKQAKYCEETGETKKMVEHKRYSGIWLEGVHWKIVQNRVWINRNEVEKWITGNQTTTLKAIQSKRKPLAA